MRDQREYLKRWRAANPDYDQRPHRKAYKQALERTEHMKARRKRWRQNSAWWKEYHRGYEAAYREQRKNRHHERQASDPQYRLRRLLRSCLKQAIKHDWQGGETIARLGCSVAELRVYLERLWAPGMSWDNFGRLWEIDHIQSLSLFDLTDPQQVSTACHFTNLQPLWALDNRRKWNKPSSGKEVSHVLQG